MKRFLCGGCKGSHDTVSAVMTCYSKRGFNLPAPRVERLPLVTRYVVAWNGSDGLRRYEGAHAGRGFTHTGLYNNRERAERVFQEFKKGNYSGLALETWRVRLGGERTEWVDLVKAVDA